MEYYSLTIAQQNIWNLQNYYEDSAISNICGAVFFKKVVDIEVLKEILNQIIERQSGLRLRLVNKEGKIKQYVKEYSRVDIAVKKFRCEEEFEQYARECAQTPIGLLECDMYRLEIVRVENKVGVLAVLSHLVSDAWTFSILAKEMEQILHSLENGRQLEEESYDYVQYIKKEEAYLMSEKYNEDNVFWKEKYRIKPSDSFIRAGRPQTERITTDRVSTKISKEMMVELNAFCDRNNISPAVCFETAWNIYLYKINSENETVTLGIPVLNRTKVSEKKTAGMFISTMPLTIDVSKQDNVELLAKKITKAHTEIFRHKQYPYSNILQGVREEHGIEKNLYDVMFSFQNAQADIDAELKWYSNGYSEVPLTMHVDNRENSDTYTLTIDYQTDLFREKQEIYRIIERLEYVLEQMFANPLAEIGDISIVTPQEMQKILYDFNDTSVDYPRDKCVHEFFMEQARKTPDEVAVVFEERQITYKELDEMSNALAHVLQEKGVQRGDIVPLIAQRSYYILVAMLGIMKVGGAYMPIAPDYPKDRVQFILQEAKSKVACVLGYVEQLDNIELLRLDELALEEADDVKRLPIECRNSADDLCYVIFTSGSTGVPKGVMITHRNVLNYCQSNVRNVCHAIIKESCKKIISVTNIVFDIFVTESILPLLNGMTIYFTNDEEVFSQSAINRIVTEHKVEVLQTTPTKMKGYLFDKTQKDYLSTLKVIILGGEALTVGLYEELRKQTTAEIFNIYGPAETTVWSSNAKVESTDITIGKPIANTQIYILDSNGNPVPIGVSGELCIAGDGVGEGYLNRSELTAERFVPNPFATESNEHGKIMYHTGDLAAWRENGEIEYLGRIDTQVKIRGLRIELGEIESVMSQFPGIRMCAVTDKKDEEGRQYLVGYYTTVSDEKETQSIMTAVHVDEKQLRKHLSSKLPKYMVPNYFMHLDKMPMTPSGKTDRKNLPMPRDIKNDFTEFVAPATETEKKLCLAMEAVLNYSPIGLKHDFFEHGGDSLKAMEYIVALEKLGYQIKLQDIFEHSSVSELVQKLQNKRLENIQIEYLSERFEKYAPLLERNRERDTKSLKQVTIKTVLLSGITGFLGAHIADALLQDEECLIYCLVRSKSAEDWRGRFPEILEYYFGEKYKDCIGTRIIPVVGDITNETLSEEMPEKVDMVIHAAATVKHYGAYEYFHEVNTLGTKHMADYAQRVGAKFIHISTISVSGNSLADSFDTEVALEEREFGEDCLYQEQDLKNVYVRSKFEAECVVLDAMLQGLQANIIRVGNLTNRSRDYVFQPNYKENAFLSRMKAAMELGCMPDYMLPLYAEFSPVDDTAEAIVKIARHFHMEHTIYHVYSNQNLYFDKMLEILKELGIPMEVVEGELFAERLKGTVGENKSYIYEAFLNDMGKDGKLNYDTNIHIQNDFTIAYLKQLDFEWPKIDYEYVKGYVEYFKRLGYLEV